ncbi:MAG: potassium transporter KefB [Alphaproteobacteria bacterium]|jgi:CPA2 family monovalent cation:H+ antiporter-2|nr:potassium transporter KefB [Alphaproteobacteria bacterium]
MATDFSPAAVLVPTVTLLGFGAAAALVSRAARISPIVGYLLAGVIIGPHALGLVEESSTTHLLAELGVVFLLFDIGMHVSMRELKESRRDLTMLAPAHLAANALAFTLALVVFGTPWPVAIAIGVSLALSSTAVVARLLSERDLRSCPLGRSATHVLIFQDIVAIFLLIFASALGGDPASIPLTMALAAGQALVAFAAAILAGRYLVGPAFRLLAATRNEEVFTAATLLLVLGAACATYLVGLSLTLGAFLAGLAVSGTPFRHQVQTESGPFRGLLLSFFFINVGLMIDVPALMANAWLVLGGALGILLVKTIAGLLAAGLSRWTVPGGTQLAFLLAQGSEFTLVVLSILAVASANLAANGAAPLLDPVLETVIVASVAVSLAAAPFWAEAGMKLSRQLARRMRGSPSTPSAPARGERPVIVFGMTESGRLAVDALRDHAIPVIALDNDPQRFLSATADGYNVAFGDAANLRLIDAIGANHARAVVIGVPRFEVSKAITPVINQQFPDMERFVSVNTLADLQRFSDLGMRAHLTATRPPGLEMATDMLRRLGISDRAVEEWVMDEHERFSDRVPRPSKRGESEAA